MHNTEPQSMREARTRAARRQRRLISNNDGNDHSNDGGVVPLEGEARVTPEQFLQQRTTPLAGTQVDSIFYCTGVVNQYTHQSMVAEFRGDHAKWQFARDLVEQGTDTLATIVDFGQRNGIEVFWSMRMNDTHDYAREINLTQWKRSHPELLMGRPGDLVPWRLEGDWPARWSALDYGQPAVREKVFQILEDVCTRYDIDGIELDFFRHPLFFRPQYTGDEVGPEHCALMTGLLQRVRTMTERVAAQRGRPLLIAARVPDSLGYSRAIGLDIEAWAREDLIDLLIGSCYFRLEPWANFVEAGRRLSLPVYACLSGSRFVRPDNGRIRLPEEAWYGEALNAWEAGVDGVYLFNVFNPHDPKYRDLGDPARLRALGHTRTDVLGAPWRPTYWLRNGETFLQDMG